MDKDISALDHRKLDDVLHSRLRLAIMAALVSCDGMNFISLRDLVGATDGNMTTHLKKLEEVEYIQISKEFVGKKPQTTIALSPKGRQAFKDYLSVLDSFINPEPLKLSEE